MKRLLKFVLAVAIILTVGIWITVKGGDQTVAETYRLVSAFGEQEVTLARGLSAGECEDRKRAGLAALPQADRDNLKNGSGYFGCQPESSYR